MTQIVRSERDKNVPDQGDKLSTMKKLFPVFLAGLLAGCASTLPNASTPPAPGPAEDVIVHSSDLPEFDLSEQEISKMGNAGYFEATSYEPQECEAIGWNDSETRSWGQANGVDMASTGFYTPNGIVLVMVDKQPVEVNDCSYVVTKGDLVGTPISYVHKVTQLDGGGTLQEWMGGQSESKQIVYADNEGGYHFVVVDPRGQDPELVQQIAKTQKEKLATG